MRARGGQLLRFLQAEAEVEAEAERQVYSADHWVLYVVWCGVVVVVVVFLVVIYVYLFMVGCG
ncbi:hypothetical protein FOXYSP1_09127 [Fusarium oxysporum f. sp. phaseoli]